MRTCYDSTSAADLPADAAMVAGYINGTYKWSDADWARFPTQIKVRIATNAQTDDGEVLDVETGDALPHEAPGWVLMRRAAGVDPTVYCNLSNVDALRAEFRQRAIPEPHYWLAHYDNVAEIPDGFVAKQYADQALIPGQPHYDLSVVADIWPGVDGGEMTPQEVQAAIDASIAAYGVRLQAELDANYALKVHPHTATASTKTVTLLPPDITVT